MGVAARTTTALYCACAAVLVASRPTAPRARAHGPTPLAARSLNLEGGARGEADRDAVETENRERLSVSGVTERFFRRLPAPPAARAGQHADGLHNNARGRGARARGPTIAYLEIDHRGRGFAHCLSAKSPIFSDAGLFAKPLHAAVIRQEKPKTGQLVSGLSTVV